MKARSSLLRRKLRSRRRSMQKGAWASIRRRHSLSLEVICVRFMTVAHWLGPPRANADRPPDWDVKARPFGPAFSSRPNRCQKGASAPRGSLFSARTGSGIVRISIRIAGPPAAPDHGARARSWQHQTPPRLAVMQTARSEEENRASENMTTSQEDETRVLSTQGPKISLDMSFFGSLLRGALKLTS